MSFFRPVATHVNASDTRGVPRAISSGIVAAALVLFGSQPCRLHAQITTAGQKQISAKPTRQFQSFEHLRLAARIHGPSPTRGFQIPPLDIKPSSAALDLHMQRDLTNRTSYPAKDLLFGVTADFFDQRWTSRNEYQIYKIALKGFHELKNRHAVAYRVMGCAANGSVSFYDLCVFGFNKKLRGHVTSQFQDPLMFAAQGDYRIDWRTRVGFVGFGGVGGVGRTWGDFRSDQLLPAGGVGMRFNLDKKNPINYRVDLAFGREGRTVATGIGEAF